MKQLIERYKRYRNFREICNCYTNQYAFVGIGSHSRQNLYPIIDYLHIPLKYICCADPNKIPFIEHNHPGITATTNLRNILDDPEVKGIFISITPRKHFEIAQKVIKSGKALFIEKPPCLNSDELNKLVELQHLNGNTTLVGMQKRYAPAVKILNKHIKEEKPISYHISYTTGQYPEGNPLIDLFIHPLDLAIYLFGKAELLKCQTIKNNGTTLLIMLQHHTVIGTLELSTAYSWQNASSKLKLNTTRGVYFLEDTSQLKFTKHPKSIMGIPTDKVFHSDNTVTTLYSSSVFAPLIANNELDMQGFFDEIKAFANIVSGKKDVNLSPLSSLIDTYYLLNEISKTM